MEFIKTLKEDPELYRAYKDNIAMAFKDTYYNYKKRVNKDSDYLNFKDIHIIANEAADNFLKLLIK